MIPVGLKVILSINILYCIVAVFIVAFSSFQDSFFSDVLDELDPKDAERRDNIETYTIVFFGISILFSAAFFIFHNNRTNTFYNIFLTFFSLLVGAFIALTILQFYYDDQHVHVENKYNFTKWWPLAAVFTNLLVVFFIFRNRRKL